MKRHYVVVGLALLLCGSYLDNIRGLLMPVLTRHFSLTYAHTSWFLVAGNFSAVAMNFFLIWLARRYSQKKMVVGICFTGGVSLILAGWVTGFVSLVGMAVLLGLLIAGAGSTANVLVFRGTDRTNRSRILCLLHLMYGVGSLCAPLLGGLLLDWKMPWYGLLFAVAPAFLLIGGLVSRWFPEETGEHDRTGLDPLSKGCGIAVLVFTFYVCGEVLISAWMTTYLVEWRHETAVHAAPYLAGFFGMMALTRGLCFFALKLENEKRVMVGCLVLSALFFCLGRSGFTIGFSLAGVIGPFFPLLLSRISHVFPRSAQTVALVIMMAVQGALAVAHFSVGELTDLVGIGWSYWLPVLFQALTLMALFRFFTLERSRMNLH